MYIYTEQTAVWCNMKEGVVFILLSFERKKKRKIDIKIKNKFIYLLILNSWCDELSRVGACVIFCGSISSQKHIFF